MLQVVDLVSVGDRIVVDAPGRPLLEVGAGGRWRGRVRGVGLARVDVLVGRARHRVEPSRQLVGTVGGDRQAGQQVFPRRVRGRVVGVARQALGDQQQFAFAQLAALEMADGIAALGPDEAIDDVGPALGEPGDAMTELVGNGFRFTRAVETGVDVREAADAFARRHDRVIRRNG